MRYIHAEVVKGVHHPFKEYLAAEDIEVAFGVHPLPVDEWLHKFRFLYHHIDGQVAVDDLLRGRYTHRLRHGDGSDGVAGGRVPLEYRVRERE
ncbi:hypothetical protein SDC9_198784 [bioreactor metagenome]|uniref:Uncharacterized protein n=1 Tax=bioreactor metagenome TaxID=1076179 RepID=A0A645IJV6_9ZZZZ